MGMFDYVKVEDQIDLPKPECFESFDKNIKDFEFQTKSLENCMNTYFLSNDKHLYKDDFCDEQDVRKQRRQLIDFHGIIKFGAYHPTDLVDYSVEYEAKFTNGILEDIKLVDCKVYNHESRKLKNEEIKQQQDRKRQKFSYKLRNLIRKSLSFFGIQNNLVFTTPEVVFFVNSDTPELVNFKRTKYGLYIDNIGTGFYFRKTDYLFEVCFKILGFGFKYNWYKPVSFEEIK
jgi:hypothetical protein